MANINIKLPEEVHRQLKIEAINQGITLKDHIIQKLSEMQKETKTRKK